MRATRNDRKGQPSDDLRETMTFIEKQCLSYNTEEIARLVIKITDDLKGDDKFKALYFLLKKREGYSFREGKTAGISEAIERLKTNIIRGRKY